MAAGGEEIGYVRRLVEALQLLRGAEAVEVRGAWAAQEEARAVVVDAIARRDLAARRGRARRPLPLDRWRRNADMVEATEFHDCTVTSVVTLLAMKQASWAR